MTESSCKAGAPRFILSEGALPYTTAQSGTLGFSYFLLILPFLLYYAYLFYFIIYYYYFFFTVIRFFFLRTVIQWLDGVGQVQPGVGVDGTRGENKRET